LSTKSALAAELKRKQESYPNLRDATLVARAFVRARPPRAGSSDKSLRWHDLADLYSRA
jgi:hypothetical protein